MNRSVWPYSENGYLRVGRINTLWLFSWLKTEQNTPAQIVEKL